jgi:DNA-binding IscR family transcriptional regulator
MIILDVGDTSRDVLVFSAFIAEDTEYCFKFVRKIFRLLGKSNVVDILTGPYGDPVFSSFWASLRRWDSLNEL